MEDLLKLVQRAHGDPSALGDVEAARDDVTPDAAPALVRAYEASSSWPARAAVVHLLQDYLMESTRAVMRHFLLGSPADDPDSEWMATGRAIALCHLERDLGLFTALLEDAAAVDAARARWSAEDGG